MACEYCKRNSGHHSSCPNADEPKLVHSCDICWKSNIFEGDTYYDLDGLIVCEDCMINSKKEAVFK